MEFTGWFIAATATDQHGTLRMGGVLRVMSGKSLAGFTLEY